MAGKKGLFLFRIVYFVAFIVAAVLLFYLFRNDWNVPAAFSDLAGLLG